MLTLHLLQIYFLNVFLHENSQIPNILYLQNSLSCQVFLAKTYLPSASCSLPVNKRFAKMFVNPYHGRIILTRLLHEKGLQCLQHRLLAAVTCVWETW